MVDIADFQGRKHVDRLLILHSCTLSWMSIRVCADKFDCWFADFLADILRRSFSLWHQVVVHSLAASLEGISMQSRSWTGSLASEDRVEFSVCWVFSGSVSVSCMVQVNLVEIPLSPGWKIPSKTWHVALWSMPVCWRGCLLSILDESDAGGRENIMLKRHWSVACPRYVCNMVKMPAWIIGSLTPYSEFGVITSSSLPRQFARVYAPLLACDVHIEELGPWFWDPMASTAMRPESGDLGVFDKTWTCSVIHLVVPDFPCSFI